MTCNRDAWCQKPLTDHLEMFVLTHLPAELTNLTKYSVGLFSSLGPHVTLDPYVRLNPPPAKLGP